MANITSYEYVMLCEEARKNPKFVFKNAGYKLPNGWSYMEASGAGDSRSGYFGVAFQKGKSVVIVHRGTSHPAEKLNNHLDESSEVSNFVNDLKSDFDIWLGKTPAQLKDAKRFTEIIKHEVKDYDIDYSHAGHSLGGALAQLVALMEYVHATVFDSPGIKSIADKEGINYSSNTIELYVAAPNIINTSGEHIVVPREIGVSPEVHGPDFVSYLKYSAHQHGIKNIASRFSKKTGEAYEYSVQENWPSGVSAGYKDFLSYQPHRKMWNDYMQDVWATNQDITIKGKTLPVQELFEQNRDEFENSFVKYNLHSKYNNPLYFLEEFRQIEIGKISIEDSVVARSLEKFLSGGKLTAEDYQPFAHSKEIEEIFAGRVSILESSLFNKLIGYIPGAILDWVGDSLKDGTCIAGDCVREVEEL